MNKPTLEEMKDSWWDEGTDQLEYIDILLDGRWRHGTEHIFIAKRTSDNTYWAVAYRTDKDGDYNDFRDGELSDDDVYQVMPQEKKVIEYVAVKTQD